MIFVAQAAYCQNSFRNTNKNAFRFSPVRPAIAHFSITTPIPGQAKVLPPVNANYYAANLGFFCKQEIKFEKITKIPFKFRLGSVAEVDRMEGKPNTLIKN